MALLNGTKISEICTGAFFLTIDSSVRFDNPRCGVVAVRVARAWTGVLCSATMKCYQFNQISSSSNYFMLNVFVSFRLLTRKPRRAVSMTRTRRNKMKTSTYVSWQKGLTLRQLFPAPFVHHLELTRGRAGARVNTELLSINNITMLGTGLLSLSPEINI